MSLGVSLSLTNGSNISNADEYCRVVGSLQYLSFTCSDIAFIVNKLIQFMHKSMSIHWYAMKRVLRYLKGTLSYVITLRK